MPDRDDVTAPDVTAPVECVGCGDEVPAERAELGYRHCVKKECRDRHGQGLTITTVAVNKSSPVVLVGDAADIARRGARGEFAPKDSGLGLDYRSRTPAGQPAAPPPARRPVTRPAPVRRPWSEQQEKVVRLYAQMGLSPRGIAERAQANTPALRITARLAIQILCTPPPRRRPGV
ncbi:hypothetical protein [Saccharothrix sp. HUAS TT1]|uniref:hypothetical protein n=1 Tax=unclassified Saccharothrix TaxID=2593673 RepID=UPI00345C3093